MNAATFRQSVRRFSEGYGRAKDEESRLLASVEGFERRLQELTGADWAAGVSQQNDLSTLVNELNAAVSAAIQRWTVALAKRAPVTKLAERYADRAILLVFGKVNSGKSTFVNFLVDDLRHSGATVRGFKLQAGKEVEIDRHFAVGATETTARIQGFEVDERLLFLDSPGLHSVTKENHEHTKLFTDSADAVLWLSPSSSPGQVQELSDLKEEMERRKPLLPVITKSDIRVEDVCEATGSITAEIRNKSREVRKEQEDDVLGRTHRLGLTAEIKPVISLSTLAYEASCRSDDDRNDAGLGRLYDCLVEIVDSANRYKVGKAEQVVRNYINEDVIGRMSEGVEPALNDLKNRSDRRIEELDSTKRRQIKEEVEADALSNLSRIVDRHKDSKNRSKIADELSAAVTAKLAEAFHRELTDCVSDVADAMLPLLALSPDELDDFEDVTMEFKRKKGAAARSILSSIGGVGAAAGGAALGTFLIPVPGVGTLIGSFVGGIVGGLGADRIGKLFEDTEVVTENVAVSGGPLMMSAALLLRRRIATYVDTFIEAAIATVESTRSFAVSVNSEIERFKKEVGELA